MKKIIFLISTLFIITSCIHKDKKVVEETYTDGSPKVEKYYRGEGADKEMVKEVKYYPNKQKQVEGEYKNDKRNGHWVYYYQNGNKWSEGSFADGLDDGKRTVYFENGNIRYIGFYDKGKKVDGWKFYDENGKLLKEINYSKNSSDSTVVNKNP